MRRSRLVVAALAWLVGSIAFGQFRAADLVVVPVAAALPGLNSSNWRSDLEIQNVDTVPIDVLIIFLPTGVSANAVWYQNVQNHLSGRTEDGFGKNDPKLKDIPPGQAVYLDDVIKTNWNDNTKGSLLVFAYQAGTYKTTTPPGGVPKLVVVRSRTYSLGTTTDNKSTTYGQEIPGLPWYYYIDPGLGAKGLNKAVFSGIREDAGYRTAVGFLNISDVLTSLNVTLTLKAQDGTQLASVVKFLYPLEHQQFDQAVYSLFGLTAGTTVAGATLEVQVLALSSSSANPKPGLIVYCSRVDNVTNDPVYLEQYFTKEFPWDCVFNGNCTAATALSAPHAGFFSRPLSPPVPAS